MGSLISLGIDKFEIEWGKNDLITDHSSLFLPSDIKLIPYYYENGIVEMKEGLSRQLSSVKKRLDLMGYSIKKLSQLYDEQVDLIPDYYTNTKISFEQFKYVITSIDIKKISLDPEYPQYDLGEFISYYLFKLPEIKRYLPPEIKIDRDFGTFFENLDPYITIRLLAENKKNENLLLQWRYADVVEGGWANRDDLIKPLDEKLKILIVTEGSSDSFIIERAFSFLYPDIADFFTFVDMEEHYPFTGTGNLYRFCQGLSRIGIQNKVLVIFDNDAAGVEKFEQTRNLNRPQNMHICRLPDHDCFSNFKTVGPNGESKENINGSAVSIECFLDMKIISERDKFVRWTSYNRELQRYQGEIESKDNLVRAFKKANLTDGSYDTSKLKFLLDYLVTEWVKNVV